MVAGLVKGRHVGTRDMACQVFQQFLRVGTGFKDLKKPGQDALGFPEEKTIDKGRNRFGVQKAGNAAGDHQRMPDASVSGSQGYSGLLQECQQMGIVVFKGNRKGDDIYIGHGPARLNGGRPDGFRPLAFRQENPFAYHLIQSV